MKCVYLFIHDDSRYHEYIDRQEGKERRERNKDIKKERKNEGEGERKM